MMNITHFSEILNLSDEYDDDPDVLRAVLSCGHITDPNSLIDCCKAQLKDVSHFEFNLCPLCKKEWPYDEVRKLAKLTTEEQLSFEEQLGTNTVKKICPGCGTFVQRLDVSNLCVQCSICTVRNRKTYEFCWQCLREWKGSQTHADRCDNEGCSIYPKLLRDCPMISLTYFTNGVQCPKLRKCPSCDTLIEHNNIGCNNIKCPKCNNEFCFICLKPGHFYRSNPCTIAPSLTIWKNL
uniref:RING-type domain-containing protein n=1 Tax=Cyprinus carpio TaxID=7962 RepID=A0A8C2A2N0_CYPCA